MNKNVIDDVIDLFIQTIRASGTPSVGWFKVDKFGGTPKTIVDNGRYKKLLDGRRLQITKPTYVEDNGSYKCVPEYGLTAYEKQAKIIELLVSCKFEFWS